MPQFLINANEAIMSRHPYAELNEFAKGYVEAMFFTNCDSGDENEFRCNELGVDALDSESVYAINLYCAKFEIAASTPLALAYRPREEFSPKGYDAAQAGRDLWFTAQGHGCGYWDRPQLSEQIGTMLTEYAKAAGEAYCEIGDDDKIYWRR